MIYLKGGHYIVADNCTFSTKHDIGKDTGKDDGDEREESSSYQDCTHAKPEGSIYWSTIDGKFGEVNPDDVYAILGAKTLTLRKPPPEKGPLEDYLITNRGESFVGAKAIQEEENRIYGMKRDDLAKINRRSVAEIAPEGQAKSRSGEGLCAGEPAEFSVTETSLEESNLVGVITNLSKEQWTPGVIEVEVRERGKLKGKFALLELNVLSPGETISFDEPVRPHLLKYVQKVTDPDAAVRLCYRKKKGPRQSGR